MTDDDIPEYGDTGGESHDTAEATDPVEPGGEAGELAELESKWGGGADVTVEEPSAVDQLLTALRNTEPHAPLEEVESPWDTEHGGLPRVYRGFQKLSGVEGTEAWLDIVLGALEAISQRQGEADESGAEADDMEAWKV